MGAAGLTAANVLRFCGRFEEAAAFVHATETSLTGKNRSPLRERPSPGFSGWSGKHPGGAAESSQRADVVARTLRVDTERIDVLVRLTGELTVAKNSIGHVAGLAQASRDSVATLLKNHHAVLREAGD